MNSNGTERVCPMCNKPMHSNQPIVTIETLPGLAMQVHDICNNGLNRVVSDAKTEQVNKARKARADIVRQAHDIEFQENKEAFGKLTREQQREQYVRFARKHGGE